MTIDFIFLGQEQWAKFLGEIRDGDNNMLSTLIAASLVAKSLAVPATAPLGDLDKGALVTVMRVIDGKLYVGGRFERANRKLVNNIAVWDGSSWSGIGRGVDGEVKDIVGFKGKIYVCGEFSYAGKSSENEGIPANRIAEWDGTKWNAMGERPVDRQIFALATDGKALYIGGNFTKINDETETRAVARWNGKKWESIGGKFDRYVQTMTFHKGKLYVAGYFAEFGDDSFNNVAVWDGTTWSEAGNGGLSSTVNRLSSDGENLYAAGKFNIGGKSGIAKFEESKWSLAVPTSGENYWVHAEAGKLFIAGDFTEANGKKSHQLAIVDGKNTMTTPEIMYVSHRVIMPFGGSYIVGGSYGDVQVETIGGVLKWTGANSLDAYDLVSGN